MASFELKCNRFRWMNIVRPTSNDLNTVRTSFPLVHPLHLEDIMSQTERPKVDEDEDYLFVVMHFPIWDPKHRLSRPSEIEFIIGRDYLVTVHDGTLKPLVNLFARCELYDGERDKFMGKGSNDAFYYIVDQLVDYIFPILRKVSGNINVIEDTVFTSDTRKIIEEIAIVRRDIISLRRIIRHQVPILEQLGLTEHPIIREDLEQYFGDTLDHIYTARDIIEEDTEIINGLAETANTLANHRTNEVVRALTVISVIMLPLTLVSGIFGMNVNLPLDEHPDAFIVIAGLMVGLALLMLYLFRRQKWI